MIARRIIAMSAGVLCAAACAIATAQDTGAPLTGQTYAPARRLQGVIRVVGPDGPMVARVSGSLDDEALAQIEEKLRALQQAASNPKEVERVTSELIGLVRAQAADAVDSEAREYGIGVSLATEVPPALRSQLMLEESEGVLVQSVAEESPAAKAGVKEYDLIVAVGDQSVKQHSDLVDAIQSAGKAGRAVSLAVISGGQRKTLEVAPTAQAEIVWAWERSVGNALEMMYGAPTYQLQLQPSIVRNRIHWIPEGVPALNSDEAKSLQERVDRLEAELKEVKALLKQHDEK